MCLKQKSISILKNDNLPEWIRYSILKVKFLFWNHQFKLNKVILCDHNSYFKALWVLGARRSSAIIVRFTQTGIHNLQYSIVIQNVMVDTIIVIRTQILVIFFNCIYCKERNNGWIYNPRYTCGVTIKKQSFFCLYRRILDKN